MSKTREWTIQLFLAVLVIYFYVFMEWLFFVTKPSFMSALGFGGKLQVLLVTPLPYIISGAGILFILWALSKAARNHALETLCLLIGRLLFALILATSLFLLVDNFTYTVFHFGIISAGGARIWIYRLLLLAVFILSCWVLYDLKRKLSKPHNHRKLTFIIPCLLFISVLTAFMTHNPSGASNQLSNRDISSDKNRPNIILLSSDGLNAEHMSVYGYHRDTTPFIDELSKNALLCENCFTNAGVSGASIASTLTGKLPTRTRVIYPPYFLKGKDAYQHLPGILKRHGYRNVDISIRHHADAIDMNMLNSFDWANFREVKDNALSGYSRRFLGNGSSYLLNSMIERVTDRLFHVFGISEMEHPLNEVVRTDKKFGRDAERVEFLISTINNSPTPFFAHVHLLETHGPVFHPSRQVFSRGRVQRHDWMAGWYDDAILDFDNRVREIIQALSKRGILNNTVMVICTDHGQRFTVNNRLPLIFIFPHGEHRGRIKSNVQNLDIAATILDYLGIEQPDWMGGSSLLSANVEPDRFIFTVDPKHLTLQTSKSNLGAPFYSLVAIGVFFHNKYFELNVRQSKLTIFNIKGHTSPCGEDEVPDPERVGRMIIDHLVENHYDVSSIKIPLSVRFSN